MVTVSSDHGDGWIFNRVCVWLAKCAVWHPMLALFDRHLFPWLNDVIAIIFFAVQIMRRGKSELNGGGHFGSGNSYHTGHRTGIKWMSIRPYMLVFASRRLRISASGMMASPCQVVEKNVWFYQWRCLWSRLERASVPTTPWLLFLPCERRWRSESQESMTMVVD